MVSSNHNLVSVGQGSKPVIEVFHIVQRTRTQAVAGMNQNVTFEDVRDASMQTMCIRDTDDPHSFSSHGDVLILLHFILWDVSIQLRNTL